MAYKVFDNYSADYKAENTGGNEQNTHHISFDSGSGANVELPDLSFVRDSDISRDGMDLVLETDSGTVIIDGYYAAEHTPNLVAPNGMALTPDLVNSFTRGGNEYADASNSMNDASPVGAVQEISGEATVTRLDGTVEVVGLGTPIYPGDVVETDEDGAVNIMFIDETSFAISEDARLAIDEYVFDPSTQSGTSNFSVLKGVFVFTSGLIGRDDPDDVMIDTPSGSIGIRGTIIAGNVNTGEITVVEGAIVLHDLSGHSITLSNQYETARFDTTSGTIEHMGDLSATDVASRFTSVSTVAPALFSSVNDSASESSKDAGKSEQNQQNDTGSDASSDETKANQSSQDQTSDTKAVETIEANTPAPQMITSSDITASSSQVDNTKTVTTQTIAPQQEIKTVAQPAVQVQTQQQVTTQVTQPKAPPVFAVEATKINVTENVNGADVAHLKGLATNYTNLELVGVSKNYYNIVRDGTNDFTIKLKSVVALDAEHPYNLTVKATDSTGKVLIKNINLAITNVDEAISVTGNALDLSGSENSLVSHNFANDFFDPEGHITNYSLVGGTPSNSDLTYTLNQSTGLMLFNLDNSVTADSTMNFTMRATTDTGQTFDQVFTFNVHANTGGALPAYIGSAGTYSGTGDTTISADNVSVFTDSNNDSNVIVAGGDDGYIKAGGGNDSITIQSSIVGNTTFGDAGDDSFFLHSTQGKFYGGDGKDTFYIKETTGISDLQTGTASSMKIDGGASIDTIEIKVSGNIDFGAIDAGIIQNIEKITSYSTANNAISLTYDNVIEMTDSQNTLIISMDGNDTLTFSNTSGHEFFKTGDTGSGTEHYDIYTDGTITLLVDTDAASVTGII